VAKKKEKNPESQKVSHIYMRLRKTHTGEQTKLHMSGAGLDKTKGGMGCQGKKEAHVGGQKGKVMTHFKD